LKEQKGTALYQEQWNEQERWGKEWTFGWNT